MWGGLDLLGVKQESWSYKYPREVDVYEHKEEKKK